MMLSWQWEIMSVVLSVAHKPSVTIITIVHNQNKKKRKTTFQKYLTLKNPISLFSVLLSISFVKGKKSFHIQYTYSIG